MVTAAQSRHSDTNITAIFAHMGHVFIFTWLQGIYFMSLFRRLKFGAFYMFSRFFFLLFGPNHQTWSKSLFTWLQLPFIVYFPLLPAALHPTCARANQIRTNSDPKPAHLFSKTFDLFLLCWSMEFLALLILPYALFYLNLTGTINVAIAQ